MDSHRFDELTRRLATGASRRSLLKGLIGLSAGSLAAWTDDTLAKPDTSCSQLCKDRFPPGRERGQCISQGTRGEGPCAPTTTTELPTTTTVLPTTTTEVPTTTTTAVPPGTTTTTGDPCTIGGPCPVGQSPDPSNGCQCTCGPKGTFCRAGDRGTGTSAGCEQCPGDLVPIPDQFCACTCPPGSNQPGFCTVDFRCCRADQVCVETQCVPATTTEAPVTTTTTGDPCDPTTTCPEGPGLTVLIFDPAACRCVCSPLSPVCVCVPPDCEANPAASGCPGTHCTYNAACCGGTCVNGQC